MLLVDLAFISRTLYFADYYVSVYYTINIKSAGNIRVKFNNTAETGKTLFSKLHMNTCICQ
jgi:hypothetical protein